jgi:hypothetical protein
MKRVPLLHKRRVRRKTKFTYRHSMTHDTNHAPAPDGRPARRRLLAVVEMMQPLSFQHLRANGDLMLREVHLFGYGKGFAIGFVTDDGTMTMTVKPQNLATLGQTMIELAERRIEHDLLVYNQEI